MNVHVLPRILAQLEEGPDVVLGQPQVPARDKAGGSAERGAAAALALTGGSEP